MKVDKVIISKKKFELLVQHALAKDDKTRATIMNTLLTALTPDESIVINVDDRN